MTVIRSLVWSLALCAIPIVVGCGGSDRGSSSSSAETSNQDDVNGREDDDAAEDSSSESAATVIAPISLDNGSDSASAAGESADATDEQESLLEAMDELNVLIGDWRATPQRADPGDMLEEPNWVWDFETDPDHPALLMSTNDSPYFHSIRLSYDVEAREFTMTVECSDDQVRELRGVFEEAPTEFQGDDRRIHITYKLTLNEVEPADERDQWQIALNQQDNNRYLVELSRFRSSNERYDRFDTINNQRQGTSFAQADDDYGERECIISGGLGTMQVSYEGKSYWVCCTGCQAAFNDDPEKWIARYEEKQREEMMQ